MINFYIIMIKINIIFVKFGIRLLNLDKIKIKINIKND